MSDSLYRTEPTPFRVTLPVLGIPVEFAANEAALIEATSESFGRWSSFQPDPDAHAVHARFLLHDGDEGGSRGSVRYRMPDNDRVLIHTPGSFALTDPMRREIVAYVSPALLADRDHFRYTMLEAATFALLTRFDRQPFHAAALVRRNVVLLLCGTSGAGKSTLTYAALRSGIDVLSEDMVYLQCRPRLRIWGVPSTVHLPASARAHFAELEMQTTVLLANGKEKIAVRIPRERVAASPVYERAGLCIVGGTGATPAIERLTTPVTGDVLGLQRESGFDLFEKTIAEAVRTLASSGGWRMTTSPDPHAALPLLHQMFDVLEEQTLTQ